MPMKSSDEPVSINALDLMPSIVNVANMGFSLTGAEFRVGVSFNPIAGIFGRFALPVMTLLYDPLSRF